MIKFALQCASCDAEFESWFASGEAFDKLQTARMVECPDCKSTQIGKQIMAPSIRGTKTATTASPEEMFRKIAQEARKQIAENCDYVGDQFADKARAMHNGETDQRPIWGQVTSDERQALSDEGVPADPIPAPFVPKVPTETDKLN